MEFSTKSSKSKEFQFKILRNLKISKSQKILWKFTIFQFFKVNFKLSTQIYFKKGSRTFNQRQYFKTFLVQLFLNL